MAAAFGTEDIAVTPKEKSSDENPREPVDRERWPIIDYLDAEPYCFDFFQAVRLLTRMASSRDVVGRFSNPNSEVLRFGAHSSVAFPASHIQELERPPGKPAQMRVNFMGLTGPSGVLPLVYSEMVLGRLRVRDRTMRDFYDLFNHRMISLFYQAWEKYRFTVPYERGEYDQFSHHVLGLLGLGTPGLRDRQDVLDDSLLFYSGLLSLHPRSATALRQVLSDYFDVDVEVEQFVGAWYPVEEDSQCSLSESMDYSERLGYGAVVGDEIWDQQSRIRIQLGPLGLDRYMEFLPGGDAYRHIRALARFYAGKEYDVEIQLILKRREVPVCELKDEPGPQLGWTSWVKSAPFSRDPGDAILEL
ncbi:MAG TPA: type VI secretion system baseplate subunit TssG [Bryobacteraceae bacterium]|nr:type VI secretion system baseplate subunit TssG [Bryobacteraceae bacterium]